MFDSQNSFRAVQWVTILSILCLSLSTSCTSLITGKDRKNTDNKVKEMLGRIWNGLYPDDGETFLDILGDDEFTVSQKHKLCDALQDVVLGVASLTNAANTLGLRLESLPEATRREVNEELEKARTVKSQVSSLRGDARVAKLQDWLRTEIRVAEMLENAGYPDKALVQWLIACSHEAENGLGGSETSFVSYGTGRFFLNLEINGDDLFRVLASVEVPLREKDCIILELRKAIDWETLNTPKERRECPFYKGNRITNRK